MVNSIENTSATVDSGMDSVVSVGTEGEANDSKSSGIGTGTGGQIAARMRSASSSALSKSHDKLIGAPPVNRIRTVPQRGWHQLYRDRRDVLGWTRLRLSDVEIIRLK